MHPLLAIAFPPVDPVALRLGPLEFRWFGIAYLAGFVGAFLVLRHLNRRWNVGLTIDDEITVLLAAVIGVLVGGRLGYVLFYNLPMYLAHPLQIVAVWDGGMSFHGGLVGIIVAGVVAGRLIGVPFLTLADMVAVGAPLGLLFGRVANFVNHELWGRVTTLPWGVVFPGAGPLPRHPSQLYEALLEGLVLFVVMWALSRKARPRGWLLGLLLTLYGVARILVEFFRQPDAQIGFLPGGITEGQLLSIPLIIVGVWVVWWSTRPGRPLDGPKGGIATLPAGSTRGDD
jgi:phosphatidylglycerol:prolipoprotein diacylglycerol transferase